MFGVFARAASQACWPVLAEPPARTSELSPAEVVALRFHAAVPVQSNDFAPAPAQFVLASAVETELRGSGPIFSPHPTYAPPPPNPRLEAVRASLPSLPEQVLAYAGPEADAPLPPVKRAAPVVHPASPSNNVLNTAQIASIRDRLKLTPYQEQLWPPVESALRDIAWRPSHDDRKAASKSDARSRTIDPDSAHVQRLNSAAVPLIMSPSSDQKEEIRTLARLMGLETLASQF
jgi:hypothetical protein